MNARPIVSVLGILLLLVTGGCSTLRPLVDLSSVPPVQLSADHVEENGSRADTPAAHDEAADVHHESAKQIADEASLYRSLSNDCPVSGNRARHRHKRRNACMQRYDELVDQKREQALQEEAMARAHERVTEGNR